MCWGKLSVKNVLLIEQNVGKSSGFSLLFAKFWDRYNILFQHSERLQMFWKQYFCNFLLLGFKKFPLIWVIWTNNWDVETYRNKLENECTLVCLKQTLRCTALQLYVPTFTLMFNGGLFDYVWLRMKLRAWISTKFLYILLGFMRLIVTNVIVACRNDFIFL